LERDVKKSDFYTGSEFQIQCPKRDAVSMSRLSVRPRAARESVFAGGPDQYRGESQALCPPNLRECVLAMEDCCIEVCMILLFLRVISSEHDFVKGPGSTGDIA
jgi:hypothetical protein